MAYLPGATFTGRFSELVVAANLIKPTGKGGAVIGGHSTLQKTEADTNAAVVKFGAKVMPYSPALSLLLAGDDF
jgi:hypothetical protein